MNESNKDTSTLQDKLKIANDKVDARIDDIWTKAEENLNAYEKESDRPQGLARMKEIAKRAMESGNFTADDVKNDLKELRSTYR